MSKQIKRPGKGNDASKPANPDKNPGYAGGLTIGVRTRHLKTGASREMLVCTFPNEFLHGLMNDDWRLLARSLVSDDSPYLPTKMKAFAAEMADRKRRPSTAQIGLLVGLFVNINVQQSLEELEDRSTRQPALMKAQTRVDEAGTAKVIPFRPRRAPRHPFADDPGSAA